MTPKQRDKLTQLVSNVMLPAERAVVLSKHAVLGYGDLTSLESDLLNVIHACGDALRPVRKEIQKRDRRRGRDRRKANRS